MKGVGAWVGETFRRYVATLLSTMRWRVAVAALLTLLQSAAQAAQLLMLVPLMQIVGLDTAEGSIGEIAAVIESVFGFFGVPITLLTVLLTLVVSTTALAFFVRAQSNYNYKLEHDFVAILRRRLYSAIANADWLTFSRRPASSLTHALTTELERVGRATTYLLGLFANCVILLVYFVLSLWLSTAMTVAVAVTGVVLLFLLRGRMQRARGTGEDITQATRSLYSASMEHLGGMKTAKSYGVEDRSTENFTRISDRVSRMFVNEVRNYADTAFWFTVGSVAVLAVILYVAFEVLGIAAAALLLLLFLYQRMIPLFTGVQETYQTYLNELPAFSGVMDLQDEFEAAAEPEGDPGKPVVMRDSLRFEDASFSYGKQAEAAIRDVSLSIEAGRTTAVVGPSGAGKSTLADLVMGLILPKSGRVLVDGSTLGPDLVRNWRKEIGYVAQDTFLFNDTVRANLLWASPEASDGEIEAALDMAAADFAADLPNGLDTVLGDRGARLSGGERQRLALARALLREPSLLILDEATSALDSENELRIQKAIEGLRGRTTILVITHRLSTIREADVIHVLEGGRLVESGGWDELVRGRGRFGDLCRAQGIKVGDAR
ncbi:MAG: ABC transporter ATP-binding protein/permease [Actinomycetota bacterium]|nr:ABC transporter ATP-binding protein/permease [Actinomycetota bacterium]